MLAKHVFQLTMLATLIATAGAASASLLTDTFEVDSSANYTVKTDANSPAGDGSADSTSQFAFDYIGAGIPLAPNSAPGTRGGLRFTVNASEEGADGPSATEEDHITAYNNVAISSPFYTLSVDMYMGVQTTQPGTTELAHIGVAGNTTNFNSIFTPIAGSGHFVSITGEGGSASDYRHYNPSLTAVPTGNASYLNSTNTTNNTGDTYQTLFPVPPFQFAGAPGNSWVTVSIEVNPATVTYLINGTPIIRTATEVSAGLVSLGYVDPFDSVGPHFVIYDNLRVVVPEPSSLCLGALFMVGLVGLRNRGNR